MEDFDSPLLSAYFRHGVWLLESAQQHPYFELYQRALEFFERIKQAPGLTGKQRSAVLLMIARCYQQLAALHAASALSYDPENEEAKQLCQRVAEQPGTGTSSVRNIGSGDDPKKP